MRQNTEGRLDELQTNSAPVLKGDKGKLRSKGKKSFLQKAGTSIPIRQTLQSRTGWLERGGEGRRSGVDGKRRRYQMRQMERMENCGPPEEKWTKAWSEGEKRAGRR